jgi:hypothetical protein
MAVMSTEKDSLTPDKEILAAAGAVAGGTAPSRCLKRAQRHQLQHDRIAGLLAVVERQQGPIDARVMAEVRDEWPDPGSLAS